MNYKLENVLNGDVRLRIGSFCTAVLGQHKPVNDAIRAIVKTDPIPTSCDYDRRRKSVEWYRRHKAELTEC